MPVYHPEAPANAGTEEGDDKPKKQYDQIPDGTWVDATVSKVDEVEKPYKDKETGDPVFKVEFTFDFTYNGEDRRLWGETSNKWVPHPGCRLRQWAQEILAADLPEEFVLNTDHLEGEKCQALVSVRTWEAGSNGTRSWNAGSKNYISDVKRAGSNVTAPAGAKAAPAKSEPYEDPF